jgi:hypothetical protein
MSADTQNIYCIYPGAASLLLDRAVSDDRDRSAVVVADCRHSRLRAAAVRCGTAVWWLTSTASW